MMVRLHWMALLMAVGLAAGCSQHKKADYHSPKPRMNQWVVQTYYDDQVRNAVIREHTVYPHHFVRDSADLTVRGRHDLDILAEHFRRYPGELNVRTGTDSKTLHKARMSAVKDYLASAAVQVDELAVSHRGMPGGEGLPAEQVLHIHKESKTDKQYFTGDAGTTSSISGGSSQ